MGHIMGALELLEAEGAKALMPSHAAQAEFNAVLQADLKKTVWGDENCGASWYKTEDGFITQNWSGNVTAYQEAVSVVSKQDYELMGA